MSAAPPNGDLVERLAELAVAFGANVQPGQIVAVNSEPGKEELTRAVAAKAYEHGAKFVDVVYFDMRVKRARLEHAAQDTLDFVPPWYGERMLALGEHRAARIHLAGTADPGRADGSRPGARRPGPAAPRARVEHRPQRPHHELDDPARAHRRHGHASSSRTRTRRRR